MSAGPYDPDYWSFDDDGNPEWSAQRLKESPDCSDCDDAGCDECRIDPSDFPARIIARPEPDLTGNPPF